MVHKLSIYIRIDDLVKITKYHHFFIVPVSELHINSQFSQCKIKPSITLYNINVDFNREKRNIWNVYMNIF